MGMKRRSARKNTRRGSRRQAGGGLGQSYGFAGESVVPGVDTGVAWTPQSSCMAVQRPGMAPMPTTGLGLPGVSLGGGRRRKRSSRRSRRSQRGGRYGFTGEPAPTSGTPFLGGYAPISHVPCEAARANPMNPTQLGGAAAFDVITPPPNSMQAQLDQTGGGQAPLGYGFVGDVDNKAYYAPTAGYSNTASTWVGSTGSPSMLQQPYEARAMNPACVKTGGGSRRRRSSRKHKSRKSRR